MGQSYHFKNYKEHGFAPNQIFSIYQDASGFLWFGTGVGLTRYDSNKFTTFSVEDGLPANEILAITAVADTTLWIGTGLGLAVFDISDINKPELAFNLKEFANYSVIRLLYHNDILWIGTRRNGLFIYHLNTSGNAKIDRINDVLIKDIRKLHDGNIAVLSDIDLAIYNPDGHLVKSVKIKEGERLKCLIENQAGSILLGTDKKLIQIELNDYKLVEIKSEREIGFGFNHFAKDKDGAIWAGTEKGLLRFDDYLAFNLIERKQGLPGNDLRALLFDIEGNLWLGSYTAGLFKLNNTGLLNFNENDGLLSNVVNCILKEDSTTKLVGSDQGIFKIQNLKLSRDRRFNEMNNEIIWFIYQDSEKNIWVGGQNILKIYQDNKLKSVQINNLSEDCTFLDMLQSADGTFWFCTTVGLFSLKNMSHATYPEFKQNGIRSVWEVTQLENGTLLFGTDNGLVKKTKSGFEFVKKSNGLPDRAIYAIHEDKNGTVWLGSDLGLIKNDGENFQLFGEKEGLNGTIISQILEGTENDFWICSEKGLQRFLNERAGYNFGLQDGLLGEEFTTQNSSLIDSEGKFWLGVFGGLTIIDPYKSMQLDRHMQLYFAQADYFSGSERTSFIDSENPLIEYKNNNIQFRFLGLYFYNEKSLTFMYRLSGHSEEWSTAERGENIRYSNLAPGTYNLQVKAKIDNWILEGTEISKAFIIDKPFWLESWFFIVIFIMIIAGFYAFFQYKSSRILAVNKELQNKINKNIDDLALAQATIENIIEHSGGILITTDLKGRITTWNRQAEGVFGYSKEFILHKNIKILDLPNDLWDFMSVLEEAKNSGELRQLEVKKLKANSEPVDLIVTTTALMDKNNKPQLITFSMEDFSERNKLVEMRINREKSLAGIEALNKLLITLSHYINNSTASISGMAQLADLDKKYTQKFIDVTSLQVKRIQAVLTSLSALVQRLNLKTKDYVGEKDGLFDIENEIKHFLNTIKDLPKVKLNK